MRKILAYSGGYDSTYALAELVANASTSDTIIAVSIIHHATGDAKLLRERDSKIIILDKLRSKYPEVYLKYYEIEVSIPWDVGSASYSVGLSQPIFWICNLIPIIKDNDEVYLGYIRNDAAAYSLNDINDMFNAAIRIQDNKKVSLHFPNKYSNKTDILKNLINNYPELVDYCTSCESLTYNGKKVCGHCVPCKHMKEALASIIISESGSIREKCLEMLDTLYQIKINISDGYYDKEDDIKVNDSNEEYVTSE